MAQVENKLIITVDPTQPVIEIVACIAAISNMHPTQQLEILRDVDLKLGEIIAQIENQVNEQQASN